MLNTKLQNNRGISLYITLLIMALLLAMGLGMSAILLGQIKIIRGMGNSVIAFYAADTGIERVLKSRGDPLFLNEHSSTLGNGASYELVVLSSGLGGCGADHYCIKSVGTFRETKRAIEVKY